MPAGRPARQAAGACYACRVTRMVNGPVQLRTHSGAAGSCSPISGLPYVWWAVLVFVAYAALVGWGTLIRANRALSRSCPSRCTTKSPRCS